jgi:hypothetical protein
VLIQEEEGGLLAAEQVLDAGEQGGAVGQEQDPSVANPRGRELLERALEEGQVPDQLAAGVAKDILGLVAGGQEDPVAVEARPSQRHDCLLPGKYPRRADSCWFARPANTWRPIVRGATVCRGSLTDLKLPAFLLG